MLPRVPIQRGGMKKWSNIFHVEPFTTIDSDSMKKAGVGNKFQKKTDWGMCVTGEIDTTSFAQSVLKIQWHSISWVADDVRAPDFFRGFAEPEVRLVTSAATQDRVADRP